MKGIIVVARREFASFFRVPAGWIVIALHLAIFGFFFTAIVARENQAASLAPIFSFATWLMLPIAPAISMRVLSEEYRTGTFEILMTAPVRDAHVVFGKFLGAWAFLGALLLPTGVYVAMLFALSDPKPDPGPIVAGYLCLMLLGGLYIALGTLASSLTNNQTLAFVTTLLLVLTLLLAPLSAARAPDAAKRVIHELALSRRVGDFAGGVIDTSHVVFFLSAILLLLMTSAAMVHSRRWR